ncbi:unnamed protein product [Psylliodes chrysocephalus]|uniref:Uncharacterized protein n=1 Tax=Psylliodes chrysocephalus TaxID=3402493 RepID=A0A9P0GDX0_9CUCU|nr:unnamed protein product [Psylliodes chrysocephala]
MRSSRSFIRREVIGNSTDDEKHFNELSCTANHIRQLSGNMVMNKEGSGPFSLRALTEDLVGSTDEVASHSRAETATPNQIYLDLDQINKIVSESKRKFGLDGCMYLKEGGYIHQLTDVEYISEEEGHFNNKL